VAKVTAAPTVEVASGVDNGVPPTVDTSRVPRGGWIIGTGNERTAGVGPVKA
jgi:hypothetical protein